jgi:uncharacterized protein DUF6065
MKLECFPLVSRPPRMVPGRPDRAWMDQFNDRHVYRCLPLTVANCTGWELLSPFGFTAEWNGGDLVRDITFTPPAFKVSHCLISATAWSLFPPAICSARPPAGRCGAAVRPT